MAIKEEFLVTGLQGWTKPCNLLNAAWLLALRKKITGLQGF